MNKDEFIKELKNLNIHFNNTQVEQLEKYYQLLIEWNENINLTAITKKEEVYLKHFYDSLTIQKIIDLNEINNLCDIGTGAGFPGLVLKIFFPKLNITLVDSLNKRVKFLKLVIDELQLRNVEVVHDRAEEFTKKHQEEFDVVTARAVSHLSNLLEYTASSIKINGYFIAMKSSVEEELKESQNALKVLNMKIEEKCDFFLPIEQSVRTLIKIKKMSKTASKYPRKYSEIKKRRL